MAKQIPCPIDITTPVIKKCWSGTAKSLQKALTARIFKEFECEDDCDLYVIVNVSLAGDCPDDPSKKEYDVVVELGCIQLAKQSEEFFASLIKLEVASLSETAESLEQSKKC